MPSYHICQQCGEVFTCRHLHRFPKFCSRICQRTYQAEQRVTRQCRNCGETFIRPPSLDGPFCSRKCTKEGLKHERLARHVSKVCPICGKSFKVRPSEVDTACCSWKCRCRHFSETYSGENNSLWNGGPIAKVCIICGKPYTCSQSDAPISKYCSKACQYPDHAQRVSGSDNPNWQGGKSFEPYTPDFSKDLKEQIRERDGRTCQLCGVSASELSEKLSVHHIDYDKANTDPANLISLCRSCHTSTHYNRKNWQAYFEKLMAVQKVG